MPSPRPIDPDHDDEQRLETANERQFHLIESLQAVRDQLRRRVLAVAAGTVFVGPKCAEEMPPPMLPPARVDPVSGRAVAPQS